MKSLPAVLLVATLPLVCGCVGDLDAPAPAADLDEPYFRCRVQPVLTKNCSTFLCHGDPQRYFRLYARNRLRLGGTEAERNTFLREAERSFNLSSARAFVNHGSAAESLLLQKPLDEQAGGFYHGGSVEYGQGDVFLSRQDPEFEVLVAWVEGSTEDPSCIEPGSDL